MENNISIEEIDTREGHLKLIFIHWNLFAFMAWDGFKQQGRGGVILDLRDATRGQLLGPEVRHRLSYLGERSNAFKNWPSEEASKEVHLYEPESEILVFVYGRNHTLDGEFNVYRLAHGTSPAPPDVFDKYNSPA